MEGAALANEWPADGPTVAWRQPLGDGHSSILVEDGRLYTMYRPAPPGGKGWADRETVIALDEATGKTVWEHTYPARPLNFRFGAGPFATPLIAGDRLFSVGSNNQLFALDKVSGKVIWSHDLVAEFGAHETLVRPAVKAGISSSPIAFRDLVIVMGGGPGQAVMAFDRASGKLRWKSGDFNIAQAAPILIEVGGRPQLVAFGGTGVHGLDPDTGRELWSHPHDTDGDMNISTPVWHPNGDLFVSSAYDGGSRLLHLTADGDRTRVEERWFTRRLRIQFSTAMRFDDFIVGSNGDFGATPLTAVDAATGEVLWQDRAFGRASFLRVGDRLLLLDENGVLGLARPTREGLTVLARTEVLTSRAWTVPTLAGTSVYARDRREIMKLELPRRR